MSTSTRANFFSSLFAVAKIALIAFAVTSSPESDVTGQVPRYFTWYNILAPWMLTNDMLTDNMDNLKLHALHNWVNLAWTRRILQQFWRRRNGVLPNSHFFFVDNSYFHVGEQMRKGIQKETTFGFSSGLRPSFLLPLVTAQKRERWRAVGCREESLLKPVVVSAPCGVVGYWECCLVLMARVHRPV